MSWSIVVIGDEPAAVRRTVESIDAAGASTARVLARGGSDPSPWADVDGGLVFLLRAGDLLLEGALDAAERKLSGADTVVCGHRLRGRGSWDDDVAPPPLATFDDLEAAAIDAPIELSTIAARREALPAAVDPPCCAPGGTVALVAGLLATGRVATTREVVAEVRMRGEHRGEPEPELERLRGVLRGPLGARPAVASRVRRRALSIACLEAHPSVAARLVPEEWWGGCATERGEEEMKAVLRDVLWAAARAAEARHIAERGFDGIVAEAPVDVATVVPPDFTELQGQNCELNLAVTELSATVRWLHEEVRARDARIASMTSGAPAPGIEEISGWMLAAELGRRIRRRVARIVSGGGAR